MAGYSRETERQNKVLKDLLRGQTPEKRVIVGYEPDKKSTNGEAVQSHLTDIMKDVRMPWFCPECDKTMKKRLDDKFWRLYGHCFDCQIQVENKMRINGTFGDWEKKKLLQNRKSWVDDMIQSIHEWRDLKSPEWYNNVGLVTPEVDKEKWEITKQQREDMTKLANEAIDRFDKMKIEIEEELVNINS